MLVFFFEKNMNDNLDDYDFTPSSSSNLASLFESGVANLENSSLTYTAPKQPKVTEHAEVKNDTPNKAESSVICARVVQVWKLMDNKYIAVGKHGLAIIGSHVQNSYEMILYKEKHNIIVRVKICNMFEMTLKRDNFASFYDSLNENWLIKFGSIDDCKTVVDYLKKFDGKVLNVVEDLPSKHNDIKPTETISNNVDNLENKAKTDILTRIAKMGQSILPSKNLDFNEVEDNNHTINTCRSNECSRSVEDQYQINKSAINTPQSYEIGSSLENQHQIHPTTSATQIMPMPRQLHNIPDTILIGQPAFGISDTLNMYVAESRAQGSEVRMNLSQISEKLNQILKLVDTEKTSNDTSDVLKTKIKVMHLKTENLLKEVKMYQEENTKLKMQINQQKENESKIEVMNTEKENRNVELDKEINICKSTINNLSEIINKQKSEIDALKIQLEACQADTKTGHDEISELNMVISDLKTKLNNYELQENTVKQNDEESKERMSNFTANLKELMNGMYGNIIENLSENKDYDVSKINSIIAQNIKSTTLRIIQKFQHIYKIEPVT